MNYDLINSLFEAFSSLFIFNHCRVLLKQKAVSGVSVLSVGFFAIWGVWNMFYYSHLNQILSFYFGMLVIVSNATYVILILRYRKAKK